MENHAILQSIVEDRIATDANTRVQQHRLEDMAKLVGEPRLIFGASRRARRIPAGEPRPQWSRRTRMELRRL